VLEKANVCLLCLQLSCSEGGKINKREFPLSIVESARILSTRVGFCIAIVLALFRADFIFASLEKINRNS
jgi:hypothetical protein